MAPIEGKQPTQTRETTMTASKKMLSLNSFAAIVASFDYRENYGSESEPYWKNKFGIDEVACPISLKEINDALSGEGVSPMIERKAREFAKEFESHNDSHSEASYFGCRLVILDEIRQDISDAKGSWDVDQYAYEQGLPYSFARAIAMEANII